MGEPKGQYDPMRRVNLQRQTPAELAIGDAVDRVEELPPDERLTNAVVKLQEAKELVADFVDGVGGVFRPVTETEPDFEPVVDDGNLAAPLGLADLARPLDAREFQTSQVRRHLPVVDPWAHRSKKMRCSSCMWFVAKESEPRQAGTSEVVDMTLGRCRRHAPTMNGYPAVFTHDWCGDHKLDENKAGRDR